MAVTRKTARIKADSKELQMLLGRALNTMEPTKIPKWALDLADNLRDTDEVEIFITRERRDEDE